MRYLRVATTMHPDITPEPFQVIADSSVIDEARLLDWNLGAEESVTAMYAIDGDCKAARSALADTPEVIAVSASPSGRDADDADGGYILVRLDRTATPLMETAFDLVSTPGLVVVKPVVYRDGRAQGRLVGEDDILQTVVDRLPERVETDIREIGPTGSVPLTEARASSLSERQHEAVQAALDLGYYDHPRRATHEDIAERLGCAPSTASEHLQKAEATLVRAALEYDA